MAHGWGDRPEGKKIEAEQRLRNAAPELLEACKLVMKSHNYGELGLDANEAIENAVAKAEGRQ